MSGLSGAFGQIFIMLVIVAVGYLATKLNYITEYGYNSINKILINIALPCMVVASVNGLDPASGAARIPLAFLMSFIMFALLFAVTAACNALLRTPAWQRPLYLFGTLCTNTGFVCLPMISAIYGNETVIISSIYILVGNLIVGTVGMGLLQTGAQEQSIAAGQEPVDTQRKPHISLTPKMLLNAPLIGCVIALALFFSGYQLPTLVQEPVAMIGRVCTPLAMMIVGSALAQSDLRSVFGEWRFYPQFLIRLLAVPIAATLVAAQWISDPVLLQVFIIMCAAPVGSMVPAWVDSFNQNGIWAAKTTVVSTLIFFIALPFLVVFANAL